MKSNYNNSATYNQGLLRGESESSFANERAGGAGVLSNKSLQNHLMEDSSIQNVYCYFNTFLIIKQRVIIFFFLLFLKRAVAVFGDRDTQSLLYQINSKLVDLHNIALVNTFLFSLQRGFFF